MAGMVDDLSSDTEVTRSRKRKVASEKELSEVKEKTRKIMLNLVEAKKFWDSLKDKEKRATGNEKGNTTVKQISTVIDLSDDTAPSADEIESAAIHPSQKMVISDNGGDSQERAAVSTVKRPQLSFITSSEEDSDSSCDQPTKLATSKPVKEVPSLSDDEAVQEREIEVEKSSSPLLIDSCKKVQLNFTLCHCPSHFNVSD